MKQVVQKVRNGELRVEVTPDPVAAAGEVLIASAASVVSSGTERMVRKLAKKSLLGKARERPDEMRRVLEKLRQEGALNTLRQVRSRLDESMALGYSSSGIVVDCGEGVQEFKPGDRVASNGPHASVVAVPKHLCARIPGGVPFDQAAFTVLGAIGLQGVRLSKLGLGDCAFVIGLGLVGQISVALLKIAGCRVAGTDPDPGRCTLAVKMGADVAQPGIDSAAVLDFSRGLGADAVLIAASTDSSGPLELAGEAVRKKGRVVVVGHVGMEVPRRTYYMKEAPLVVSCSYGPGRYDPLYEERGIDYPAGYVRWTEQRNMQAVLDLMASGKLDVSPLISHRFPIDRAAEAYELLENASEPYLGVLFEYAEIAPEQRQRTIEIRGASRRGDLGIGLVGAGSFAGSILIPTLAKVSPGLRLRVVCSAGGLNAAEKAKRFGFELATSDEKVVYSDPEVDAVLIATPHNLHAKQVVAALEAGKHVFVEKPLALSVEEVLEVERVLEEASSKQLLLQVGFNRRFSPAARQVRKFFQDVAEPLTLLIRFNAGSLPPDHWTQMPEIGGGRIIGEACHAIDLATFLANSRPVRVFAESVGGVNAPQVTDDRCLITLRHANGSISTIAYLAGGDRAFPKERVEVFGGGRVAVIGDFRQVVTSDKGRRRKSRTRVQDKGHRGEIEAFLTAVREGGAFPIPWTDIKATSLAAILAVRSLREGVPFRIPE